MLCPLQLILVNNFVDTLYIRWRCRRVFKRSCTYNTLQYVVTLLQSGSKMRAWAHVLPLFTFPFPTVWTEVAHNRKDKIYYFRHFILNVHELLLPSNKELLFGSPNLYESKLRSLNNKQVKEFIAFSSSTIAQKQLLGTDVAKYLWYLHGIFTWHITDVHKDKAWPYLEEGSCVCFGGANPLKKTYYVRICATDLIVQWRLW